MVERQEQRIVSVKKDRRLLYVCYGNSCRSIMAEALTRAYWGDAIPCGSAGISPLGRVMEATIRVLEEVGVSTVGLESSGFESLKLEDFTHLINLSGMDVPPRLLMNFVGSLIDWNVRDPFGGSLDAYRQTRDAVEWLVTEKVPRWVGLRQS